MRTSVALVNPDPAMTIDVAPAEGPSGGITLLTTGPLPAATDKGANAPP
jgi:hypothetical protein